jgi:serine/threonine protein kinase
VPGFPASEAGGGRRSWRNIPRHGGVIHRDLKPANMMIVERRGLADAIALILEDRRTDGLRGLRHRNCRTSRSRRAT